MIKEHIIKIRRKIEYIIPYIVLFPTSSNILKYILKAKWWKWWKFKMRSVQQHWVRYDWKRSMMTSGYAKLMMMVKINSQLMTVKVLAEVVVLWLKMKEDLVLTCLMFPPLAMKIISRALNKEWWINYTPCKKKKAVTTNTMKPNSRTLRALLRMFNTK